jgi:hypothetical protein
MVKCSNCENSYPNMTFKTGFNTKIESCKRVRCKVDKFKRVRIADRERYCNVEEWRNK